MGVPVSRTTLVHRVRAGGERRLRAPQERRDARCAEAARLREQGLSIRAVAKSLGIKRKTVGCAPVTPRRGTMPRAAPASSIRTGTI